MSAPIYWNEKLILAKIETTAGEDAVPTGADAVLPSNVSFSPMEGKDEDRLIELPFFGSTGTIPLDVHATLSYEVELAGSGVAGTPPPRGAVCCVPAVLLRPSWPERL